VCGADRPTGRTFVIGIDGVSYDLIKHYVDAGELPFIASVVERGSFGMLQSVLPPASPPAWTTITTGVNPGKHGIFDFVQHNPRTLQRRLISSRDVCVRRFYHYAGDHGRTCCVANVPITYPPEPVPGALVTGMLTPDGAESFTYPASLGRELTDAFPGLRTAPSASYSVDRRDEYLDYLLESVKQHGELAAYLMEKQPSDLFFFVFMESDHASHKLWGPFDGEMTSWGTEQGPYYPGVLRVLQGIDRCVESLAERMTDDDTLVMLSDHGNGPQRGLVNVNRWLVRQGLLTPRRSPLARVKQVLAKLDLVARAYRLLARVGLGRVVDLFPRDFRLKAFNTFQSLDKAVDWERTRAYLACSYAGIHVNLAGRQPHGCVQPGADYDEACRQVIESMMAMCDEDGRPLVSNAVLGRDIYSGPRAADLPDVLLEPVDYEVGVSKKMGLDAGPIVEQDAKGITGGHDPYGFLIAAGPGVRAGAPVEGAALADIAPTVLHFMGCPIPEYMDGRVLADMFDTDYLSRRPVQKGADTGASGGAGQDDVKEGQDVLERLQDLGYI